MASSLTATLVFTDLVGSTELLSRVGEVRADELRREHFGLLRAAVAEHGGREVKNLGDGLMVVFEGVTGALACAVAMQQAITGRSSAVERLAIRVGVASGECDMDDGDYFGLPVVEAARLCAKADSGEILATELVRALARSRSDVELDSVGALELKGLDEPVETYRVRWSPIDRDALRPPLPARLVSARTANFVGRADERARLADGWKTVVGGERRLLLVAGEPGIGKTTLAAQYAADVYDQGGTVVYGRCNEDLGLPYQPWVESLGQLVAHAPESVLAAHVADRGAHLARMVPELARRTGCVVPDGGDGDAERFVLYGCVIDLLARLSDEQPVLVVLDDLHWADRATVQLLRHVATAEQPMRVGVLGTFRDSEIGSDHPVAELLAALHRQGGAERITLSGFTDLDLLALLETIAGHEMDDNGVALRDALLAETAGNPFFAAEILRHLAELGAIYQRDDGRWVADADLRAVGLPVSVREVIGRRIASLGADTERVLVLASVIGRDFDIGLLAAIAKADEDTVIDLCDAAVAAAVLATTERFDHYAFAHALIEHTLYDSLSPARRARAHNTVAETLETLLGDNPGDRTPELAYHWAAAVQPTAPDKAIHYAHLAGDRALEQLAPDDAVRWYSQALELASRAPSTDQRKRIELVVGLGIAQRQTGNPAYRETLLDAAHKADRHDHIDLLVRATLANNRGWFSRMAATDGERIAVIDRALERLEPTATANRARLLALAAVERIYTSPLAERVALADQAVAAARASGDPAALAATLITPFAGVDHPSTLSMRTAWLDESCELADRLDDPVTQYWAHTFAGIVALQRAEGDTLDAHRTRSEDTARRIPDAGIKWNHHYHSAYMPGLRGDLTGFEQLAGEAFAYGTESGDPDALGIFSQQLLDVRFFQGRLHELVPLIEQAVVDTPGIPAYRAVLALANAHAGDRDEVQTMLTDAALDGFPMPDDNGWSTGIACWAMATAVSGTAAVAPPLRALLLPYHDQIPSGGTSFLPAIAQCLGQLDHLLGDHDAADEWFTEALDLHERVRSPILIATTNAAHAGLLADRARGDDRERARKMAIEALDAATAGGYGYVEADARAVLDRLI